MAITIINQPMDYIGQLDDPFFFWVDCAESGLAYRWQRWNGSNWTNSTLIGNATPFLHDAITTGRTTYLYRCRVSDGVTEVYTDNVQITLGETPPVMAQLCRLRMAKQNIISAIQSKGVTSAGDDTQLDDLPALIMQI